MAAEPQVLPARTEALWFLGTLVRIKLDAAQTAGRFSLIELVAPHGAAPPLHSHPQDETFFILEGEITVWVMDRELTEEDRTDQPAWLKQYPKPCGPGSVMFAPGGTSHTFRVESDTARALVLSTPAGIEEYMRALGEPATWSWLPPPADGPRVPLERLQAVGREQGVVNHGPPPPPV